MCCPALERLRLQFLLRCGLPLEEKRFWKPALAADLERSKILGPPADRSIRLRLPPELEPVEIVSRDLAFGRAFK
jgi:hypothetical protein